MTDTQTTATGTETTTAKKPTRNAATQLHVFYEDAESSHRSMSAFNFKQDLDTWLEQNPGVTVLKIVRGTEKKFTAVNKVTLA